MKRIFHTILFASLLIHYAPVHAFHREDAGIANPQSKLTFWEACETGDLARVTEILHQNHTNPVSINAMDEHGDTGLHIAIIHEQTDIATYLIKHEANVNLIGMAGMTPLQLALLHDLQSITQLLLKNSKLNLKANDQHGINTTYYIDRFASPKIKQLYNKILSSLAA